MHAGIDIVPRKQRVVDLVGFDMRDRRAIDRLERPRQVVLEDVRNAVDATGADRVEEFGRELGERGADAAAGNHRGTVAPKEVGELAHPVEIRLQSREEYNI